MDRPDSAGLTGSLWRCSLRSRSTAKNKIKKIILDSVNCGDIDCDPAPKSKTWTVLDSCLEFGHHSFPEFGSDGLFCSTPDTTLVALMEFPLAPATAPLPAPEPSLAPATALLTEPTVTPSKAPTNERSVWPEMQKKMHRQI